MVKKGSFSKINTTNIDILENLSDAVIELHGKVQVQKIIENPRSRINQYGTLVI